MSFKNVFASPSIGVSEEMEGNDIKYLESLPHIKREQIPTIILENTAYQLVLDKYLHLYELCWKYGDDEGNNERFAQCLGYQNGLQLSEIDAVAMRLVTLPIDNPSQDIAKEFFKRVCMGELEFACRMHITSGYTAYDLASAYYHHYNESVKLTFGKRYEIKEMIFLPE